MSTTPAAPSPAKKVKAKPKVAPAHPTYLVMVKAAITALKDRKGSSRQAILNYIKVNYKINENNLNTCVKNSLKRGVKTGDLKQPKGTGASGSFKLGDKKEPKKKTVKKTVKTTPKKSAKKAKKPAAAKKVKKPAAKKAAAKKPKKPAAKKPAAKKPAAKKAVKKVVKRKGQQAKKAAKK